MTNNTPKRKSSHEWLLSGWDFSPRRTHSYTRTILLTGRGLPDLLDSAAKCCGRAWSLQLPVRWIVEEWSSPKSSIVHSTLNWMPSVGNHRPPKVIQIFATKLSSHSFCSNSPIVSCSPTVPSSKGLMGKLGASKTGSQRTRFAGRLELFPPVPPVWGRESAEPVAPEVNRLRSNLLLKSDTSFIKRKRLWPKLSMTAAGNLNYIKSVEAM